MGKLKYSLISLLAVCLTAGGVFAAWQFTDGTIENPDPVDVNVSTEGLKDLEFQYVSIKFDPGVGVFPNDNQQTEIINIKGSALKQTDYNTIFPDYSYMPVVMEEDTVTHYFSHWKEKNGDENYVYYLDETLNEDKVFEAVYVSADNPLMYTYDVKTNRLLNVVGAFTFNKEINDDRSFSGAEYKLVNFISTGRKSYSQTRDFCYAVNYNGKTYKALSTTNTQDLGTVIGSDYVYDGLYDVFFRYNKNNESNVTNDGSWWIFGDYMTFSRKYNYELIGNPSGTWAVGKNPISLGYLSENEDLTDANNPKLIKNYMCEKVYFPKSTMVDGVNNSSREFKISASYFSGMIALTPYDSNNGSAKPVMKINDEAKKYVDFSKTSEGANLKVIDPNVEYFMVYATVTYKKIITYFYDYELGCNIYVFGYHPETIEMDFKPIFIRDNYFRSAIYSMAVSNYNVSNGKFDTYSVPLFEDKTIGESVEYFKEKGLYQEAINLLISPPTQKVKDTFDGVDYTYTFKGLELNGLKNSNPSLVSFENIKTAKPESDYHYYLRYEYGNVFAAKQTNDEYVYVHKNTKSFKDNTAITEPLFLKNTYYIGTSVLGIWDGKDVEASKTSSKTFIHSTGLYYPTISGSTWTIKKVVGINYLKNGNISSWYGTNVAAWVWKGSGSGKWAKAINKGFGNANQVVIIDLDITDFLIARTTKSDGSSTWGDGNTTWNQTGNSNFNKYSADNAVAQINGTDGNLSISFISTK